MQLRTATSNLHQQVEATPVNRLILSEHFSIADYKTFIERNFYIHQSLETSIFRCLGSCNNFSLRTFFDMKTDWLIEDAKRLGIDLKENYELAAPVYSCPSQLLGGLYVIEGSMLGGKMIHKALKQNPNLKTVSTFRFLENYGAYAGKRWRTFQAIVESETGDVVEAIRSAKETFLFYKEIFEVKLDT